jgi:carboxyl-terminal processing protease
VVTLSAEQRAQNAASFDQVWTTIRDQHFDPTLGGLDWEAVKTELRPKAESAMTMDDARGAMNAMIYKLGQSHFGIIPASSYEAVAGDEGTGGRATEGEGEAGESGIHLREVEGRALVFRVDPGSAGERAGVKPGWILEGTGDTIAKVKQAYGDNVKGKTMAVGILEHKLDGDVGQVLDLKFLDGTDKSVTVPVTLGLPSGTASTLGNLPTMFVTFASRRIPAATGAGDVGYLTFSMFLDPARIMPQVTKAVTSFSDCAGIIIDLRGNPGGIGAMAMGVAGHFMSERATLGEMKTRESNLKFIVYPRASVFAGPVAILIDETSASTSEILAGGLKDLGRARIFGTPSAGQALPSTIAKLPNGDGFQFAFANYISAGGKALEGDGVTPDTIAAPDRAMLLVGRDPAIDAASEWIRSTAATTKTQ